MNWIPQSYDWTGSAAQRREQRGCRPPADEPEMRTRFYVPAGAEVQTKPVESASGWLRHVTRRVLDFDRYERKIIGMVEFREMGWMVRARWKDVIDRNGMPPIVISAHTKSYDLPF